MTCPRQSSQRLAPVVAAEACRRYARKESTFVECWRHQLLPKKHRFSPPAGMDLEGLGKLADEVTLREELHAHHHGQSDMTLSAFQGSKLLGVLSYSRYAGRIYINMVEVVPSARRQGVGRLLLEHLYRQYGRHKVHPGYRTDDGVKLTTAVAKDWRLKSKLARAASRRPSKKSIPSALRSTFWMEGPHDWRSRVQGWPNVLRTLRTWSRLLNLNAQEDGSWTGRAVWRTDECDPAAGRWKLDWWKDAPGRHDKDFFADIYRED